MLGTLHLVDPAAREAVAGPVPFDPARETVEQFRQSVEASHAGDPVPCEERIIAGPPGAPQLRVLVYRPEKACAPSPAILYLHGGGYVAGTPDMMGSLCHKLAQETARSSRRSSTGSRPKPGFRGRSTIATPR